MVEIELLENGDYHIKFNHQLLADIDVQLSKVPEEKRGGVARALLSACSLLFGWDTRRHVKG